MNPPGFFTASYDGVTKILSIVVCLALLAAAAATQNVAVTIIALLSMLLGYAYSPRGYSIGDGAITIDRRIGNVRVPLDAIREARLATPDDFRGCVRLWGSGGLFGYYGLFRTSTLGRSTWYMTRRKPAVIVISGDPAGGRSKTILLSPDDIDGFLSALRSVSRVTIGISGSITPYESTKSRGPLIAAVLIGVGLGVGGMLLAVGAITYNPGPPSYTLTAGSLAIHDRFYPLTLGASSVDVPAVRVVDLAREPDWRPRLRVGGFANSHYQSGWFQAGNGMKMRMYRAGGRRLVLLPPAGDGNSVLLEVADPDAFVEQLRATWR